MSADLTAEDRAALVSTVGWLEAAWNNMDGLAFAAPFASDAYFVTIRGERFRGRTAIAAAHEAMFRTGYAGSTNRCITEGIRLLRPEVALVHVYSVLDAPSGSLGGRHGARLSLVLTKEADGWEIAALHCTMEVA
jgi:uncharacterized protein (TIGR02246 family)